MLYFDIKTRKCSDTRINGVDTTCEFSYRPIAHGEHFFIVKKTDDLSETTKFELTGVVNIAEIVERSEKQNECYTIYEYVYPEVDCIFEMNLSKAYSRNLCYYYTFYDVSYKSSLINSMISYFGKFNLPISVDFPNISEMTFVSSVKNKLVYSRRNSNELSIPYNFIYTVNCVDKEGKKLAFWFKNGVALLEFVKNIELMNLSITFISQYLLTDKLEGLSNISFRNDNISLSVANVPIDSIESMIASFNILKKK